VAAVLGSNLQAAGLLCIDVLACEGLEARDSGGTSDPYVAVSVGLAALFSTLFCSFNIQLMTASIEVHVTNRVVTPRIECNLTYGCWIAREHAATT
jgi:hypothetical protein